MPLNFINKERTRTITICDDVDVVIMGLSAMQKEDLLVEIMQNEAKPGCWRNLSTSNGISSRLLRNGGRWMAKTFRR